ncbi:26275_t:CDS:2 [Dentiscutata erythropus]|uniref:26275_t:CDS:1 n=1 Tax=Dentiscutata erythropus TaxID=1348616 RepID=A0A9N8YVN8_9GLOM|nr:26275_t:CDS:2 [Dentiscutata erythropus]
MITADLMDSSISEAYRKRLEKAQAMFVEFACWVGLSSYLASDELVAAFLAWLELFGKLSEIPICLIKQEAWQTLQKEVRFG